MMKGLRRRFIALSMSAMLVLLAAIVAGMNLINYKTIAAEADGTLLFLAKNGGVFPEQDGKEKRGLPPQISPEAPYENRYFSVLLDADGRPLQIDVKRIRAVSEQQAAEYAVRLADSGRQKGFVGTYRFLCHEDGNEVRYIFLDCGRNLYSFRAFRLTSIGMALIGYLAFSLVIFFFSGRIVRPVEESYEKQKRFITDAGHEIKTPLAIIRADADVLEMELGESEWLADIRKQTKRLTDLTNDLVQLSRMEEDASMPMLEFPVSDVISETASSFASLACTQGKDLRCRIEPRLSMTGNEKAIRQLAGILLDNALKYSPENSSVVLVLEKQSKSLVLSVQNVSAAPILREQLPLLFERFYRTDPSRNSQTGGYGIGLSLASAIVTAHGGRIKAESDDGESLQVTASFPV